VVGAGAQQRVGRKATIRTGELDATAKNADRALDGTSLGGRFVPIPMIGPQQRYQSNGVVWDHGSLVQRMFGHFARFFFAAKWVRATGPLPLGPHWNVRRWANRTEPLISREGSFFFGICTFLFGGKGPVHFRRAHLVVLWGHEFVGKARSRLNLADIEGFAEGAPSHSPFCSLILSPQVVKASYLQLLLAIASGRRLAHLPLRRLIAGSGVVEDMSGGCEF